MAILPLILLLLFVGPMIGPASASDAAPANEASVQAALLFNFGKYVAWPSDSEDPVFRIVVWKDQDVADALHGVVAGKQIDGRPVEVLLIDALDELIDCRIVYLPRRANLPPALRERAAMENLLTVGRGEEFLRQGGMIRMDVQGGRVVFEIDEAEAWRAELRIDAELLGLAQRVVPKPRIAHP